MGVSNDVISRLGDTELWIVAGEEWELPVLVDPFGPAEVVTHVRLRPPLDAGITTPMLRALDRKFDGLRVPVESDHVILKYEDLQTLARKAPGITPGYYVKWPGEEKTPRPVEDERMDGTYKTDAGKEFCAYLSRLTGVVEYRQLRVIWTTICQYGAKYLIEEKKPIDLGFCKIIPCPYRVNWKSLLQARFPGFWRKEVFLHEGFTKQLHNTVLAQYNTEHKICAWGLEVVPGERWRMFANGHEARRRSKLGGIGYAQYWNKAIEKVHRYLLESFCHWADGVRIPCGQLDDGPVFGNRAIGPWVPQGRIRPQAPLDPTLGSVVVDPKLPELIGPGPTKLVSAEKNHVPSLSDLRTEPRHVRLLGGKRRPKSTMAEPEDGSEGTDGMRLLDAPEEPGPAGDVLAEGDGI